MLGGRLDLPDEPSFFWGVFASFSQKGYVLQQQGHD